MVPVLRTIRVGQPRIIETDDGWVTSFYKDIVAGPVFLAAENLAGDRQADLSVHGGPDKAVCVYSMDHYPDWRRALSVPEAGPGWFGENFSVQGQTELSVAIGDVFQIGEARVQVTQPRGPCWKLARRWGRPDLPKRVVQSRRSGWYLRVLKEGYLAAGDQLVVLERPCEHWTIDRVNLVTYARGRHAHELQEERVSLAGCPALAANWRAELVNQD